MSKLDDNGSIKDAYENFIALSRYARWIDEENRRETWGETVDRVVDFYSEDVYTKTGVHPSTEDLEAAREAIKSQSVMPSMRVAMTAGEALQRNNIAGFNCSFVAVDNLRAFDEALIILMHGTGLGFSVSEEQVSKIPPVADEVKESNITIIVEDSKEGWAAAYRDLVDILWDGYVPKFDVSKVRPAGSRLKTFGGRASGPEPLVELFEHTIDVAKNAVGRKITPIEAHSIMCKIAEVVVVGGTRRSALISLSDLGDETMAVSKSGEWWEENPHFSLANNSAIYYVKPTREQFDREWKNLAESGSGERGIFNLEAAQKKASSNGRRDGSKVRGTNPSLTPGTKVYTTDGVQNIEDLEGSEFYVRNLNGEFSKAICWQSGVNKPVYDVRLRGGHTYGATEEHKWPVWNGETWERRGTLELKPGDKLPNLVTKSMYPDGTKGTYDQGFLIGWNLGDGWQTDRPAGKQIGFIVSDDDREFGNIDEKITKMLFELGSRSSLLDKDEINVNHPALRAMFQEFGVKNKTEGLPEAVWDANVSDDFRRGIIDALISTDGSVDVSSGRVLFLQSSKKMVDDFCSLLGFFGIKTNIEKRVTAGSKAFKDKEIYKVNDRVFESYVVKIGSRCNVENFSSIFTVSRTDKQSKILKIVNGGTHRRKPNDWFVEVLSVEEAGTSDVWDVSVFDETHAFQIDHCVTGNCGEIFLRNGEFCNLSEVIVRDTDTLDDLKRKVEVATKIGTWQSTLTDLKYIRDHWKENTGEERLLGVSLTGQLGHPVLFRKGGDSERNQWLRELKQVAIDTNAAEADRLGIPRSVAITTCKPSGTVSQLTSSASGMHPWHNDYYIRSVRGDNKDPITQFMKSVGIPNEACVLRPESTTVFSFPRKAPEGALTRKDLTAIEHLEIWLDYQRHWCEHNPSVTISVKDDEWDEVGEWVWEHFDEVTGVSFLPFSDHTYQQAPYQDCTKEEYEEMLAKLPESIDWSDLSFFETTDENVTGIGELACSASTGCEVVDLVQK